MEPTSVIILAGGILGPAEIGGRAGFRSQGRARRGSRRAEKKINEDTPLIAATTTIDHPRSHKGSPVSGLPPPRRRSIQLRIPDRLYRTEYDNVWHFRYPGAQIPLPRSPAGRPCHP